MPEDTGETIERDVPTPAWKLVAGILRGRILAGQYRPGHAIPSEALCGSEFRISRGTCRKAIAVLRDEGLIYTVPGRGSYVSERPPEDG